MHDWPGYAFLRLAYNDGMLADTPVDIRLTTHLADTYAALLAGEIDAAATTLDNVLALRALGIDVVVALIFNTSTGGDGLVAKPEFETLADLRGKRIAREDNSLGKIMLHQALLAGGLREDDITIVPFSSSGLTAWQMLNVDALVTHEPDLSDLENQGAVRLFDSRKTPSLIVDVLAVRRSALRPHASTLRKVLDAHFQVLRRWREDPLNMQYRLADRLNLQASSLHKMLRGISIHDAQYNRQYLSPPASLLTISLKTLATAMLELGLIGSIPPLDEVFVADLLPETLE
jgi:NitT/TauT family transport system substrate-binding protein